MLRRLLLPVALVLAAACTSASAAAPPADKVTAQVARCSTVSYSGRTFILYYSRMSCRRARRRVRYVHRHKRLRGWRCSSGSRFRTGGYCKRGRRNFGWHPGD